MGTNKRLIDANVKTTINASVLTGHTMRCENGVVKIFNRFGCLDCVFNLKDIPTVDAVEVVHGRWIHDINNLYGCSECMERETMSHKKLKSYCPNCGAKMDGGK